MEQASYYLNLMLLHLLIAFIVNLPKQDKATKNWARLFGLAQVIMAVQVLVGWQFGLGDVVYILSGLNNLFYLGAALILLEKQGDGWHYLLSDRTFQYTTLASALAMCLLASSWLPVAIRPSLAGQFREVALAIIFLISIVVYLIEAAAYFYFLGFFRHRWIRYLPLLLAIVSSTIELIVWYKKEYPSYVILISSGIRYLYYIPTLMIVLTSRDVKNVFGGATTERKFILDKETGFVEAVGRSTAAHKVLLLIKKPDFILKETSPVEDNFLYFGWHEKDGEGEGAGGGGGDLLADITEKEQECVYKVCQSDRHAVCESGDGKETIMIPILMYGGMIGVLFVRLHKGVRARAVFVEKLKHDVQAILPLVQSSRQMAAIRMLSDRFTTNLIGEGEVDKAGSDGPYPSVTEGVNEMLVSLLRLLSPLGIALKPSQHFNSKPPVLWQTEESIFPVAGQNAFEQKYFAADPDDTPLEEVRLLPFRQELALGRLIMFVRHKKDDLRRPTIGIHVNVYKALGALINNTLKTIIRRNLHRILRVADKRIGEGGADGPHIAQELHKAAQAFGVSWVVIALDRARFFGDGEKVAFVRQRADVFAGDGEFIHVKVKTADERKTCVIHSTAVWDVNSLPGGNGSGRHRVDFWFGVDRPDFQWDETWPGIFRQFSQFGTNKVKDMLMMEMESEIEKKIDEIEKSKRMMTLVNLHANQSHQFGTLIKNFECAVKNLELDIEEFDLELPERMEQDMVLLRDNLNQLLRLYSSMFEAKLKPRLRKGSLGEENEQFCDLRTALNDALSNVEPKSKRFNIKTRRNGSHSQGELPVETPYEVAYLSIYNLLDNSIKALSDVAGPSREKVIEITTVIKGESVYCRIKDTGQGLEDVSKLYELESGLGLHITKASLQNHNCTIELVETGPSGTTFELRFPFFAKN